MCVIDPDLNITTVRRITAEHRAEELVCALRNAVAGTSHWRVKATRLLEIIDAGILPEPHE
jgi:hypothetical protein